MQRTIEPGAPRSDLALLMHRHSCRLGVYYAPMSDADRRAKLVAIYYCNLANVDETEDPEFEEASDICLHQHVPASLVRFAFSEAAREAEQFNA